MNNNAPKTIISLGIDCFKNGNDSLALSYLKPILQDSAQLDSQQLIKVKLAMQLYYADNNLNEYSLSKIESLVEHYNNNDSLKIAALHRLSYDLIGENKNIEAIKYIKDALAINDTSSSIYYIPLLLSQAHAYEILELHQEVVETFYRILQSKDIKENYYYIGTLQNAARYYNRVGYVEEAIKHIKKAIKAIDKSNYDKHAELLSDLARFYYDSNKKDKGIKLQEEVIEIRKSNFKNDNDKEKLTTSLSNLIYYYDHNNDSINSFNTKHELIDNDYPLNSRRTYFYAYELSYHYYEKENIEKAVHYGIKAVELFEKNKEEYINDYISLVCYLRDIYLEINEYEQAIIYQKKYINTFTDKNSEYATAIALLAEYYTKNIENEANIRLALELLKEAANIRLELEGITSDSFIRTQLNIANHLMTLGQYNESIKYLESCLSNLDSNSDRYILCLKFMATAYARLKNNNKAIELFQGMQEKAIERKDTLTYLESIVEIAEYDSNLKNLNNNIEKCQYVINTIENVKSSNNQILELYNNAIDALGNLYIRYGNHKQASICFEKSLKNTEFKEGKNSFNYLGRGTQLLNCYTYTDIKKADSLSLLLLDIAHNMSNNSYLAHLNNRSVILSIMKRHEEAIKCLKEVRDSYRIIYGVNSPIYATVCHNIGIDYSSIRKDSIAINYFNEALRIRKIHENSNPFEYLETLYSIITSKMSMNIDCKNDAEYYLSKCILLLSDIKFMSSEQRFLFHKSFNKKSLDYIVFNNIEDTELLYNYILFSKELLLELDINNDINRQLYTWNHLKQKMREDDITIEFINYPKDEQANLWQYDALIIKKDYEMPIALKRYHRSVVSGTIVAHQAVPPVSL